MFRYSDTCQQTWWIDFFPGVYMVKERTYFGLSTDIDMHYKIEAPYCAPSTHSLSNSINIINKGMEHDGQKKEAQML